MSSAIPLRINPLVRKTNAKATTMRHRDLLTREMEEK
jgi:hypothetical protein